MWIVLEQEGGLRILCDIKSEIAWSSKQTVSSLLAATESETKRKLLTTTTDHVGSFVVTKSPEDETQKDHERAISLELLYRTTLLPSTSNERSKHEREGQVEHHVPGKDLYNMARYVNLQAVLFLPSPKGDRW